MSKPSYKSLLHESHWLDTNTMFIKYYIPNGLQFIVLNFILINILWIFVCDTYGFYNDYNQIITIIKTAVSKPLHKLYKIKILSADI